MKRDPPIRDVSVEIEILQKSSAVIVHSTEPFKGHSGGKNSGFVEKNRGGRKKYFSNVLRSLTKPVVFGQTLPVYFTACSGSYSSVFHNGAVHRALF